MRTEADAIRKLASDIQPLRPTSIAHVSLVGMMAGALYSLLEAAELDYVDSRSDPSTVPFAAEFASSLAALANESATPASWRSGFYFNSALMRLDLVDTRLATLLGTKPLYGGPVRDSVNSLKHDVDAHVSGQNTVTFAQAVDAAERLSGLLKQAMPS